MIREATPEDIPALLEMGEEFHRESGWGEWAGYDRESWGASLKEFVASPHWTVLVADKAGLVGFICGVKMPLYFNRNVSVVQELLWWARPEHRDGVGRELLDAFHQGADIGFQTVSRTTPRFKAVERLLRMLGWTPVETTFLKRLG